ncbi:MAG: hypothetical protein AB8I08_02940 [Sandaracinaceae bacterium]
MLRNHTLWLALLLTWGVAATTAAQEQPDAEQAEPDTEQAEPDTEQAGPTDPARVVLPAPTLPDPEPIAPPEPETEPEEEEGPDAEILFRISRDENEEALPSDVGFETPGDLRTESAVQGQVPSILQGTPPPREASPDPDGEEDEPLQDPEALPPTFAIAAGGGWSRWLTPSGERDYARIEERFEVRVPDFEALRIGAGAAQLIGLGDEESDLLFEGGVRVAFGFFFCRERWIRCEGTIAVQPGVIGGDLLGASFDLNAGLDLRFLIEEWVEVSLGAAYSLVGTTSFLHAAGLVGVTF